MALRIPKAELAPELRDSMIERFGVVPEPLEATWHSPGAAQAAMEFGAKAGEWQAADGSLKSLAHIAVAARVGCGWCLDMGYFLAQDHDLDVAKAGQVPSWRESRAFSVLERDVLEYAEAMTATPPAVTDELSARLLDRLGPAALVELTVFIAFANMSTRSNTALGVESQGFSDACDVPAGARPRPRSSGAVPAV